MIAILLWTLFFLCIAAQGFFLSALLLIKKENTSNHHSFLGLFIFVFSIILLFWVGYWNDLAETYSMFDSLFYPIPFLLGPLLLIYFQGFLHPITYQQGIHFIPFLLALILSCILLLAPNIFQEFDINKELVSNIIYALHTFSFLFYSFATIRLLSIKRNIFNQKLATKFIRQLKMINLFFAVFAVLAGINFLINRIFHVPIFIDIILAFIICIFVYMIGYIGLHFTTVWKVVEKSVEKYARSGLDKNITPDLIERLIQHIEYNESYLDNNYKLEKLSLETNIPSHYISELFNKYLQKSFPEVINRYRVEEAKKRLLSKDRTHIKPSAIGDEVGFNSSSTFYFWFKKITGMPPASFRKMNKKN